MAIARAAQFLSVGDQFVGFRRKHLHGNGRHNLHPRRRVRHFRNSSACRRCDQVSAKSQIEEAFISCFLVRWAKPAFNNGLRFPKFSKVA